VKTIHTRVKLMLRTIEPNKAETGSFLKRMLRKDSAAYAYIVDTASTLAFYIPVCTAEEVWIAGMSLGQSLKTRALGIVTTSIFGRPYGKFRDYAFKTTKTTDSSSFLRKAVVDTSALMVFWMPMYVGQMYLAGASKRSIIIASAIAVPLSLVEGRPFGMFMDWMRKKAGLKSATKMVDTPQNSI